MGVEAGDVEGLGTPIHDGRAGQRRDDELRLFVEAEAMARRYRTTLVLTVQRRSRMTVEATGARDKARRPSAANKAIPMISGGSLTRGTRPRRR